MIVREMPEPVFAASPTAAAGVGIAPPRIWPLAEHPAFEAVERPGTNWALVTCFFNPAGHARPVHNLGAFLDWCFAYRMPIYAGELVFHDQVPVLPQDSWRVFHFRLGEEGVMFQKEALLSKVVRRLPPRIRHVFLVDADVIMQDPEAFSIAAGELERVPMVHPFSDAVWLNRAGAVGGMKKSTGWAAVSRDPQPEALDPGVFHPGFCVGLRRDFFEVVGDLYGCPITGTGDAALWQAALAPYAAPAGPGRSHYTAPAPPGYRVRVADWCRGQVACIGGQIQHFWHGEAKDRAYGARHRLLADFRPAQHLRRDGRTGLPVWTEAGRPYQEMMRAYFASRAEDV